MGLAAKSLVSIGDLADEELHAIVCRGVEFAAGDRRRSLEGAVVGVYFTQTSTRTRTAFSSGALRLGAGIVTFGPADLQIATGESWADTGRIFAGMLDVMVMRTAGDPAQMRSWVNEDLAVINAMSAAEHPTQALTDLTTLIQHFGHLDGLRLLYVGEANNTATSLALALTRYRGVELEMRTPPGYGLPSSIRDTAMEQAARTGSVLVERHDMAALPAGVDAIYTTRWRTTGSTKATEDWRTGFLPFQVHQDLWRISPHAVFLHDLPAHRGEEVTAEVLDGPASIAFKQADNKLYSAMAVLEWSRTSA
jgi:ornithine carbamoyltransferase